MFYKLTDTQLQAIRTRYTGYKILKNFFERGGEIHLPRNVLRYVDSDAISNDCWELVKESNFSTLNAVDSARWFKEMEFVSEKSYLIFLSLIDTNKLEKTKNTFSGPVQIQEKQRLKAV